MEACFFPFASCEAKDLIKIYYSVHHHLLEIGGEGLTWVIYDAISQTGKSPLL